MPDFDDEQTYNNFSVSFKNLIEEINFRGEINDGSDAYAKVTINKFDDGLQLDRCDYYYNLKCFCIQISPKRNTYGIQKITIEMKIDAEFVIVAPHNYYSMERKHTLFQYKVGYVYTYDVQHSIFKMLPLKPNPCSPKMDWKQDPCKLKYINDKVTESLNCTTPWLLNFARLEGYPPKKLNNFLIFPDYLTQKPGFAYQIPALRLMKYTKKIGTYLTTFAKNHALT